MVGSALHKGDLHKLRGCRSRMLEDHVRLLVGIFTWPTIGNLQRRQQIRRAVHQSPGARALFIMPAGAGHNDSDAGDFFKSPLHDTPKERRKNGKFFLTNAFFRFAVALTPSVEFVARTDDDALFNVTEIARQLGRFAHLTHVVFGPQEEWYMWDRRSMMPTCMAYSSRRWETAKHTPGRHAECLFPTLEGPFPYAKGAFTAFSAATARLIVSQLDEDEAWVRGGRNSARLTNPHFGKEFGVHQQHHPRNLVLLEDVYYCYLVYRALNDSALTLVNMPMAEYVKERVARRKFPFASRAFVYHKLRRPERFEPLLTGRPSYLTIDDESEAHGKAPRCELMSKRYRPTAQMTHCCQGWMYCTYLSRVSAVVHDEPQRDAERAAGVSAIAAPAAVPAAAGGGHAGLASLEAAQLQARNAELDATEREWHVSELGRELGELRTKVRRCVTSRPPCSAPWTRKLRGQRSDLENDWVNLGRPSLVHR